LLLFIFHEARVSTELSHFISPTHEHLSSPSFQSHVLVSCFFLVNQLFFFLWNISNKENLDNMIANILLPQSVLHSESGPENVQATLEIPPIRLEISKSQTESETLVNIINLVQHIQIYKRDSNVVYFIYTKILQVTKNGASCPWTSCL
jgi:hypothetical protein